MTSIAGTSEIIGREAELATLGEHMERAENGSPSLVLVCGDAGIGKTRLLTELVDNSSGRTLWGGCLPLGERGLPYLALIEMLRSLDESDGESVPAALEALVPRGGQSGTKRAPNRTYLFHAVIDLFEGLAARRPLTVVFEDIHWADQSTRDLLDFLVALLRDQRILLIASVRTDELDADHPLRPLLAEWARRSRVSRIDLAPLPLGDGLRLVMQRLDDPSVTSDTALRLVERAGGNPYFLEELAAAGVGDTEIPGRLKDLLLGRIKKLPPPTARLLSIASVGGTAIDEETLAKVAGLDLEATREQLRTAIEAQLVVIGQTCRFRHALLAEALHDDLLPAERREYHAAFADVMGALPHPPPPAERAAHQTAAGRFEEGLAAWMEAAVSAEEQFAFAEASHSYRTALDLWDQVPDPESATGNTRIDMRRALAESAFLAGDFATACTVARELVGEIDPALDSTAAAIAHHRLARYLCDTAEYEEALPVQRRAVELIPESPASADRAEVLSGLARILQYEGRYGEAGEAAVEAIDLAMTTGAIDAEVSARNTLGNAICATEDVERGITEIRRALDLARRSNNAHEQARSIWNLYSQLFSAARWVEAIEEGSQATPSLRRLRPDWIPELKISIAEALVRLGRWDEADVIVADVQHEDPTRAEIYQFPELHVYRGELERAREVVAAKTSAAVASDTEMHLFHQVNLAEIELAEGQFPEALATVDGILARSEDLDVPLAVGYTVVAGLRAVSHLAFQARIRGDSSVMDEAMATGRRLHRRLTETINRPGPADGWKREVGALAVESDAELSRVEGGHDAALWTLAVDRWTELAMPYHAAYCRFRWAEAALTAGADRVDVAPVLEALVEELTVLGAKPLEDDVRRLARRARIDLGEGARTDRFGLTAREREVLSHLARGATNRQIATSLYISEKTASVHVSNIIRKLGTANRGEAAAKAISEGLVDLAELGTRG